MKEAIQSIRQLDRATYILIASFLVLNMLDGILTVMGHQQGAYEINAVARHILNNHAIGVYWCYKLLLPFVMIGAGLSVARYYPRQVKWGYTGVVGIFGAVCIMNIMAVLLCA